MEINFPFGKQIVGYTLAQSQTDTNEIQVSFEHVYVYLDFIPKQIEKITEL